VDKLQYLRTRQEIWEMTKGIRIQLHEAIEQQIVKAEFCQRLTGRALPEYQVPPGVNYVAMVCLSFPSGDPGSPTTARRWACSESGVRHVLQTETMEYEGPSQTIRCANVLVLDLDE
jgi:hypothetical protein